MSDAGVDPTTGLQYDQARWYDPHSGQFLIVDPKVQTTWQAYAYANNDPLVNIDPTGEKGGVRKAVCLGLSFLSACGKVADSEPKALGLAQDAVSEVGNVAEQIKKLLDTAEESKTIGSGEPLSTPPALTIQPGSITVGQRTFNISVPQEAPPAPAGGGGILDFVEGIGKDLEQAATSEPGPGFGGDDG